MLMPPWEARSSAAARAASAASTRWAGGAGTFGTDFAAATANERSCTTVAAVLAVAGPLRAAEAMAKRA